MPYNSHHHRHHSRRHHKKTSFTNYRKSSAHLSEHAISQILLFVLLAALSGLIVFSALRLSKLTVTQTPLEPLLPSSLQTQRAASGVKRSIHLQPRGIQKAQVTDTSNIVFDHSLQNTSFNDALPPSLLKIEQAAPEEGASDKSKSQTGEPHFQSIFDQIVPQGVNNTEALWDTKIKSDFFSEPRSKQKQAVTKPGNRKNASSSVREGVSENDAAFPPFPLGLTLDIGNPFGNGALSGSGGVPEPSPGKKMNGQVRLTTWNTADLRPLSGTVPLEKPDSGESPFESGSVSNPSDEKFEHFLNDLTLIMPAPEKQPYAYPEGPPSLYINLLKVGALCMSGFVVWMGLLTYRHPHKQTLPFFKSKLARFSTTQGILLQQNTFAKEGSNFSFPLLRMTFHDRVSKKDKKPSAKKKAVIWVKTHGVVQDK